MSDCPNPLPPSPFEVLHTIAGLLEQIWRMQQKQDADLRDIARMQQILISRDRQPIAPTTSADPIADHRTLEYSRFPPDEQTAFMTRWRARPVTRVNTASRALVSTRGADEAAPMWLLLAANDASLRPVVLAPGAYVSGGAARNRGLAQTMSGVFDVNPHGGRQPVMDRPAWVTPLQNEPDMFVVSRAGLIRG